MAHFKVLANFVHAEAQQERFGPASDLVQLAADMLEEFVVEDVARWPALWARFVDRRPGRTKKDLAERGASGATLRRRRFRA